MDRQQAIYLAILNIFKREGIHFAYPTQTLMINDGSFLRPELKS
jgi:small-conductance mechanosensitive channel